MHAIHHLGGRGRCHVYDAAEIEWRASGKAGVLQRTVRADTEHGRYLGLIGFEPLVRSGCTSTAAWPPVFSPVAD
ncbi:MAG: hypothetical protein IPM01_12975 [Burkholderiaceae bacterium]|nr:hypothetical protein [Burkholderiaceae bacterium]